jgi:hypothetical protein
MALGQKSCLRDVRRGRHALSVADLTYGLCGNYAAGRECIGELVTLAAFWKLTGAAIQARHLAMIGNAANSIPLMISTRNAYEATGANFLAPLDLAILGSTHAALGKFNDARRYVADAMDSIETNKENGSRLRLIASLAKSHQCRPSQTRLKPKPTSSAHLRSLASRKLNPANSAPPSSALT